METILKKLGIEGIQSGAGTGFMLTCEGEVVESVSPIDQGAVEAMQNALKELKHQEGRILCGGKVLSGGIFDTGTSRWHREFILKLDSKTLK